MYMYYYSTTCTCMLSPTIHNYAKGIPHYYDCSTYMYMYSSTCTCTTIVLHVLTCTSTVDYHLI